MAKRANGDGTISQRADGRWQARISLPGGKRQSLYGKTYQEVRRQLTAALKTLDDGAPMPTERQTVAQYLASWLKVIEPRLRRGSYIRYRDAVRLHLTPTLGKLALTKLKAQHLDLLYATKLKEGLAPATVQRIHAVLHKALHDAERQGVVVRNEASLANVPRAERKEMWCFTPEEAQTFLDAITDDPLEAFYVLAINTGMRRGELLALHWKDVHLETGSLEIRYTLQDEKQGRFSFAPPKTERSRRTLPLNNLAVAALRRHKVRQKAQRLAVGECWEEQDLVFTTGIGGPMRGNHLLQRHFEPLCKRLGLPRIRLHDLRHTTATLMLSAGVPTEVISRTLGHSSSSVTSDIYLHPTSQMQEDAVSKVERLLTGRSGKAGSGARRARKK
jgi:integrase